MMPKQVFIDESIRNRYILSLVFIDLKKVAHIRKSLVNFSMQNRSKIHMFSGTLGFKNKILNEVSNYDIKTVIIEDLSFRSRKYLSRQICLRSAFEHTALESVDRIVLDRSSSQEKDLITYQKSSRKFPTLPENLHHIASRQEPLLWLPDIFAWSYGAGGIWRQSIDEKISFIKRV